jgi:hypothetical protein
MSSHYRDELMQNYLKATEELEIARKMIKEDREMINKLQDFVERVAVAHGDDAIIDFQQEARTLLGR